MKEISYSRFRRLCATLGVGLLALAGLLLLLGLLGGGATPATAATEHKPLQGLGDVYCVTPEGGSYAGCTQVFTNVQYAVDAAIGGEIIKVAAGTYTDVHQRSGITQVVRINMPITIQGGYTTTNDFAGPPDPETYPTTLDAGRQGRVVCIVGVTATLEGLRLTNGSISGDGGGIFVHTGDIVISGCQVFSNTAGYYGGGVYLYNSANATLMGNNVFSNTADNGGGGVYLYNSANATLTGNEVFSNTADDDGGGVFLYQSANATLTGNEVYRNTADDDGGGIYLNHSANLTMMGNDVYSNTADNGGGVYLCLSANATLVNNMVLENRITGSGNGAGIYVYRSDDVRLLHTTLVRNSGGNGHGVYSTNEATLWMTNTILVSHTVGIGVASGATATLTATLWGDGAWANGDDWDGYGAIFTGTVNLWGDPAFVNPNGGDYHITDASAARDAGVDAGVTTDIDGDPRPWPAGGDYDIGADEWWPCVSLTNVTITGPVTGTTGAAYAFTTTVAPPTANLPITYTWSPQPDAGQGSAIVTYTWMTTGAKSITLTAENCGGVVTNTHVITIAAPPCTALTGVDITGPVTGTTGAVYTFTTTVAPLTANLPITYTWSPQPDAGQGSAIVTYTWMTTGAKSIILTAENCGGPPGVSDTHVITIAAPPCTALTNVDITGPVTGTTGAAYAFTATVAPPTANLPITYTWSPQPDAGQGSAIVAYTWMTTGTKAITVTAENCGGPPGVSDTHAITITAPPPPPCTALTDVGITGPVTGAAGAAYTFTATVAPPTATLPITYTWSPQPDAGQGSAIVTYTWMTTGTKAITVTAENCGGPPGVSNTHTIAIAAPPWWYVYLPLVMNSH